MRLLLILLLAHLARQLRATCVLRGHPPGLGPSPVQASQRIDATRQQPSPSKSLPACVSSSKGYPAPVSCPKPPNALAEVMTSKHEFQRQPLKSSSGATGPTLQQKVKIQPSLSQASSFATAVDPKTFYRVLTLRTVESGSTAPLLGMCTGLRKALRGSFSITAFLSRVKMFLHCRSQTCKNVTAFFLISAQGGNALSPRFSYPATFQFFPSTICLMQVWMYCISSFMETVYIWRAPEL